MQAILVFLTATAIIGVRGFRSGSAVNTRLLLILSVCLALALYSRRIV